MSCGACNQSQLALVAPHGRPLIEAVSGCCRTVEEFSFDGTPLGLLIAACSVVASGTQQILVRSLQQVIWDGMGSGGSG